MIYNQLCSANIVTDLNRSCFSRKLLRPFDYVNITKLRKMKTTLSGLFKQLTLGVNLFTQTLTQCLNELSHAFHFLLSYWQPAFSYGQTSTRAALQFSSLKPSRVISHAYQDHQHTQTASLKRTTLRKNSSTASDELVDAESKTASRLSSLKEALNPERLLLRLFNGLYTFWENKRLRWGMLFLLIFAPAAKFAYLLFPESGFGEYLVNLGPVKVHNTIEMVEGGWYWTTFRMYNWYFLFIPEEVLSILFNWRTIWVLPKSSCASNVFCFRL